MKIKLTEQQFRRVILKEQHEEGTGNPIGYGIDNYENIRVKLDRQGLTTMPDPESLPETMEILNLETNNIEELDLTGYHKFKNLFVLNLTNNPIRRINMQSILMGFPSGLYRIQLSYDRDYISPEEIHNFENFVHGISPDVDIVYEPINMEYI